MGARVLPIPAMLLAFATLIPAQKVQVDYDHQVNFTPFQTYSWTPGQPQAKNPLMDQRIRGDVDAQLSQKGLKKVTQADNPNLTVFYQAEVTEQYSLNSYGMGGWRWGMGGMAQTDVSKIPFGGLAVTIGDAKNKAVIWRATATGNLSDNPEKVSKGIQKAVAKMFKKYPPPVKK